MTILGEVKITEISFMVDGFCKEYTKTVNTFSLSETDSGKKHRNNPSRLSDSEVITLLILFYLSGYRCLKHCYLQHACLSMRSLFSSQVSYNRFAELEKKVIVPMVCFLKTCLLAYWVNAPVWPL
jgi:hypothetical protein